MQAEIDHLIHRAIAGQIFPGAVVLVAREGARLHHAAYGATMYAAPGSRPLSPTDIFDIASLTKVFTASAALALHDAGLLDLEAPARRYLPRLQADQVLVRHLLTHTSGLDARLSVLRALGPEGIRATVYGVTPARPPGSVVAYTNINSFLLGEVVSALAGMPLDAAIGALILEPLGMRETGFCPPPALRARIPPTEVEPDWRGLVHGVVHDESACALGGVAGHAGLFSTVSDLERLLRMWLQGGAWEGRQVLREATVAAALRDHTGGLPALSGAPTRTGLGWMLDRTNFMGAAPAGSFGHTGFTGPAMVGVPARGLALVVLSNRTYPRRTPPPYRHHAVTAAVLEAALECR